MLAEIPSFSTADVELGLLIITVILAVLTWLNVHAANKLIKLQTEPLVHVEARWNRSQFEMGIIPFNELPLGIFIKNRGGGPARDIDFAKMEDDFSIEDGNKTFKQAPLVKEGIKELAPTQEMPLAWLSIPTVSDINRSVKIEFEYKNLAGKSKPSSNFIPFRALVHTA